MLQKPPSLNPSWLLQRSCMNGLRLSLWTVIAEGSEQKTLAVPNQSGLPKQCILQCTGKLSALRLHSCRALSSQSQKQPTPKNKLFHGFPLTNHIPVD